VQYFET